MNSEFMKGIFGDSPQDAIKNHRCMNEPIGCGKPITAFKDALSKKEYNISGLCQECQDKLFIGSDEEEDA